MPTITDWRARLANGQVKTRAEVRAITPHPIVDFVEEMEVTTDSQRIPKVTVLVEPGQGTRVFTRRLVNAGGAPRDVSVAVIEVLLDPGQPDRWVRLYVTPDGPIVSTRDIAF